MVRAALGLAFFPCLNRVTGDAKPASERLFRQAGAHAHIRATRVDFRAPVAYLFFS
jgi:hypothetical protein